jgi:hypothetical protein
MSLNDGFSETFIFHVKQDVFKVVLNYTKGMCTVYAPNGRILMRMEKLPQMKMNRIQKQINDYIDGKSNQLPNFNSRAYWGFRII